MSKSKKELGQTFTPQYIVNEMLDLAEYKGQSILQKHVIDNSCGNGAFLTEVIKRYVNAYEQKHGSVKGVKEDIEKFIHGIEIDEDVYLDCIERLSDMMSSLGVKDVKFNIQNIDTLDVAENYYEKMDYVVGNPPYVRVHNLQGDLSAYKKYDFTKKGMIDLYLIFYEISLNMLKDGGKLIYITPNSFLNTKAGLLFRDYVSENKCLHSIVNLGHYNPFDVTVYTAISLFIKGARFKSVKYYTYNSKESGLEYESKINYRDMIINRNIFLSKNNRKYYNIVSYDLKKHVNQVDVKNGYATLSDKVFISKKFDFKSDIIDVVKSSTGEWFKSIYPYNKDGSVKELDQLDDKVKNYLLSHRDKLKARSITKDTKWYEFGRSQAIGDTYVKKIAVSSIIKDVSSIKINEVPAGSGVFGGLYIKTELPTKLIEVALKSNEFVEYVKFLNKSKNGGYYTFSAQDLSRYLNYLLSEDHFKKPNLSNREKRGGLE